jgi:hypothetical protein
LGAELHISAPGNMPVPPEPGPLNGILVVAESSCQTSPSDAK